MVYTKNQFQFSYSKRAISMIVLCVVAVCVLTLATSTRPDEYQAMAGFMTREQTTTASTLLPHSVAAVLGTSHKARPTSSLGAGDDTDRGDAAGKPLTPSEIEDRAQAWVEENPHEANRVKFAVFFGLILFFWGLGFLLYSEVSTVLVVRELDLQLESGLPMHQDLEERAGRWARGLHSSVRPLLSLGGLGAMVGGALSAGLPLCSVMAEWGLAEGAGDCVTVVLLDAVLQVVLLASLAVALIWSCTRPYASLLLLSVSFGAMCAAALSEPLFTLAWALAAGLLAALYLSAVPEARPGYAPKDEYAPLRSTTV